MHRSGEEGEKQTTGYQGELSGEKRRERMSFKGSSKFGIRGRETVDRLLDTCLMLNIFLMD